MLLFELRLVASMLKTNQVRKVTLTCMVSNVSPQILFPPSLKFIKIHLLIVVVFVGSCATKFSPHPINKLL